MGPKKTDSSKKRTAVARQKRLRAKQINLGDQVDRWGNIKTIIGVDNDSLVAKFLIDNYLEARAGPTVSQMSVTTCTVQQQMSTPKATSTAALLIDPEVSSVTEGSESAEERSVAHIEAGTSGVKRKETAIEVGIPSKIIKMQPPNIDQAGRERKSTRVEFDISTTDLEDFYDPDYDPDDPTFQPEEWDISIVQSDNDASADEYGLEDDVFDIGIGSEDEEDIEVDNTAMPEGPGVPRMKTVTEDSITERKYIVSSGQLETLLAMFPKKTCTLCHKPVQRSVKNTGCTVICKWSCEDGHLVYRWSSSPMLPNGVYSSNFQAVSSVVLSGNNFAKIALFAQFLGLCFPKRTSFNRVQAKCVVPVVNRYWENIRQSALEEHRAVQVVVSGDGRMDSPGHSAKFCTYTVMNQSDKVILAMEVVDKRETGLKSVLMEAKGFAKAMESIKNEGVQLQEIVTDAHPQISSIMKKSFPEVRHSYDMWHGAKNLGKKMSKIACVKGNESLKPWLKDITNHFFHCAETCSGNVLQLKTKWLSVLNHVTNRHSWALGKCEHGPIEDRDEKQWLNPSSKLMKDLSRQVMEKRLLRTFPYYVTCQTTSELETFNNHLLMYAPKRNAFSYTVYRCRCQLAAIDYSKHLGRQQLNDKDGNPRCKRIHSKAANNWSVVPVKEPKKYSYIPELLTLIGVEYCSRKQTLRSKVQVEEGHPKLISSTIAPKSPPPTAELRDKKISRIKGKKEDV